MKKYNIFCLKIHSFNPSLSYLEVTPQKNVSSFSRRDIFEYIFQNYLPSLENCPFKIFGNISVSISRSFFSPFNMFSNYHQYAFNIDYLKDKYNFLSDKIILASIRFSVITDSVLYSYNFVFFAKEVCDE